MSISAISGASSANALQQLLSLLQSQAQSGNAEAGQNQPDQANGAERGPPRGPPPGPPPSGGSSGSQFNGVTLAQLLSSQSTTDGSTATTSAVSLSGAPSSQQFASQLISQMGGSNGEVSLSQIESSLGLSSSNSSDANTISSLTNAFKQLDTNGDGELSTSELASALPSGPPQGPPPFVGGGASGSSDVSSIANTLSSDLISALGGSSGEVTLAEWTSALSGADQTGSSGAAGGSSTSNQTTDAATQLFNSLDTNGDGSLSTSEIASALQAFLSGQPSGQSDASAQGQNAASLLV